MSSSSGFKVVAFVVFVSVGAVIVIDRVIETGALSPVSFTMGSAAAPATASQLPKNQQDVRGPRPAAKSPSATESPTEYAIREEVPGSIQFSIDSRDGPYGVTPGISRSQLIKVAGNPTLRVIETRDRKLIERFIYIDANRQRRTVAVLENGQTVRSYTERYFGVNSAKSE